MLMSASETEPKKKRMNGLVITCEILPPGSLRRRRGRPKKSSHERWEEIVEICAEVIGEERRD